ncbi:aminotransferase class I/II-fold pyridoxal phosphate-dependent enzyme [Candidatus Stoquefichus massiliensis]|uniref:aminotransferase class I/II-fold pyridoxal phosphate-dependent enzyme n=1 Tax=Candidatus Stoquefichus massiliensis TaxID=1470350 RepID=UPI000482A08F|nr:aminotransferase class I/II-fold pyridoxal phosphate-dependent enzyme [Candidatus Stoquefichus massiliensis]
MKAYQDMNREELMSLHTDLSKQYNNIKSLGLNLNMARGKPDFAQTELSLAILDIVNSHYDFGEKMEYCNYGILDGIPEAKEFFAEILETTPEHMIIYGNSSLTIMFDQISRGYTHGYLGNTPWCQLEKVKFLCPVPGYDRHFAITEHFGIEMINIPLYEDGPDMDMIEKLVNNDECIKGIWCVPQYSNPSGIIYSDEVVKRFSQLQPAAKDFRLFWDNAYIVHHLYDEHKQVLNILSECEKNDNADIVFEFCSTSKITLPGAGVAALATSLANKKDILSHMSIQCIGHDKLNQLRHIEYFNKVENLDIHMQKQAALLRPKFEAVLDIFNKELNGLGIGQWTKPLGGYFITFESLHNCAKDIIEKCKEAGTILTSAGAPFPYGKDPLDSTIRIAPSYPTLEELKQATELFTLCVKLVSVEKLLSQMN